MLRFILFEVERLIWRNVSSQLNDLMPECLNTSRKFPFCINPHLNFYIYHCSSTFFELTRINIKQEQLKLISSSFQQSDT